MKDFGNDQISLNEFPTDFEEMGEVNYTDFNMLFYYEIRSTKLETFY